MINYDEGDVCAGDQEPDQKVVNVKEDFLYLCKQYSAMGQLFKRHSKVISHTQFSKTPAPTILKRILEQYQEIGEQLKTMGANIDALGGKPVLELKPSILRSEVLPVVQEVKVPKPETDTPKFIIHDNEEETKQED